MDLVDLVIAEPRQQSNPKFQPEIEPESRSIAGPSQKKKNFRLYFSAQYIQEKYFIYY